MRESGDGDGDDCGGAATDKWMKISN